MSSPLFLIETLGSSIRALHVQLSNFSKTKNVPMMPRDIALEQVVMFHQVTEVLLFWYKSPTFS